MPHAASRPLMPVVIDGSGSSYEQSPRFMEAYGDPLDSENVAVGSCESQLREDLAEAMLEISIASHHAPGGSQSVASYEDLSSSSFSSASRASLDARSSPTPSYGAENMMVFPGDSSGSI